MPNIDFGNPTSVELTLESLLARESCVPRSRERSNSKAKARGAGTPDIARAIEGEIIPRLVLARRTAGHGGDGPDSLVIGSEHVEQLARLLVAHDTGLPMAYVRALIDEGAPLGAVYRDLLAPAARRLGELWTEDRCSFFEVTVGLCALHQVLHTLSRDSAPGDLSEVSETRKILLVPAPGEQHTFGLMMVGDAFRRSGWDVRFEAPLEIADLSRLVRQESYSVMGMSVGCDTPLKSVARSIVAARRVSANRSIGVLVGGSVISREPALATRLGADATAGDGPAAVEQAEKMLRLLSART
ncbi:MAG: cobalamin B12-binding domain-containing protein [Steroidobacteraceae bacterium]